jgi:hypothetical protein
MRRVALNYCAVLLVAFVSVPAHALVEPLVLYDAFRAPPLAPQRWFGAEFFVGRGTEAIRRIEDNRLHMFYRAYGAPGPSSAQLLPSSLLLFAANPDPIRSMETEVRVRRFETSGCPGNSTASRMRTGIHGAFFNTGTPTANSAVNDVRALIGVRHLSTDPPNELEVVYFVSRCTDENCLTPEAVDPPTPGSLGRVTRGQEVLLRVQWDRDNDRFLFQRDGAPEVVSSYAHLSVPDTALPGRPFKALEATHIVPTCTSARPGGFWDVSFDDVFVNKSAVP